jgi:hypothetical protein
MSSAILNGEFPAVCEKNFGVWTRDQGGYVRWKNQGLKISFDCPFNETSFNISCHLYCYCFLYCTYTHRSRINLTTYVYKPPTVVHVNPPPPGVTPVIVQLTRLPHRIHRHLPWSLSVLLLSLYNWTPPPPPAWSCPFIFQAIQATIACGPRIVRVSSEAAAAPWGVGLKKRPTSGLRKRERGVSLRLARLCGRVVETYGIWSFEAEDWIYTWIW